MINEVVYIAFSLCYMFKIRKKIYFLRQKIAALVEISTLNKILDVIDSAGGEIYVVGGPVRDLVLNIEPKDIDFIVRNLTYDELEDLINQIGVANIVGKSFGIIKGKIDGYEFDFALPRIKEEVTGVGHRDFEIKTDPYASIQADLGRRDFTWNAMAIPLADFIKIYSLSPDEKQVYIQEKVVDPYGGLEDLKKGELKGVGDSRKRFEEDYLRILRALQFATRMKFDIDEETKEAIKELAPMLHPSKGAVTGERILMEFEKAWTKGRADSQTFIRLLFELGIGEILFGKDFNPYVVKLNRLFGKDKIIGQFIAFFLDGGDYKVMINPNTIEVTMLDIARNIQDDTLYPHEYIGSEKNKNLLYIVKEVFDEINPSLSNKVQRMMNVSILPKELAIKGGEMIDILDIKDRADRVRIGKSQGELLRAIWDGEIQNNSEQILEYIRSNIL